MNELSLEKLWDEARDGLLSKRLAIVCNTKRNSIVSKHCGTFNLATEYFSDDEFEEIVSIFSSIGIDTNFFTYEDDFFRYVIGEKQLNLLVYNAAQSGTGPGRKSLVPAFCNLHGILCTGSNAYVVSLCRQKYHINCILSKLGICAPKTWLYSNGWLLDRKPGPNEKILLKPIYESASIGIDISSIQLYSPELDVQIHSLTEQHNQPIIAQEFIPGYEVEVPLVCIHDKTIQLTPIGISVNGAYNIQNEILDYKRIYFDRYDFYNFARYEPAVAQQLCVCAQKVARILNMQGLCRVDFRVKSNGTYYVTDVSTNPHFVTHSSVNKAFQFAGLSSNDIAKTILSAAVMQQTW